MKDTLPDQLKVGEWYEVPAVDWHLWGERALWPVLGPKHEDKEIIKFEYLHYHVDWRFLTVEQYSRAVRLAPRGLESSLHAIVLSQTGQESVWWREEGPKTLGPPVYVRRRCNRQMPPYPSADVVGWLPALYEKYADVEIGEDLICPHRGAPLKSLPVVFDCVLCPLHGLKWNVKTRRLSPPLNLKEEAC